MCLPFCHEWEIIRAKDYDCYNEYSAEIPYKRITLICYKCKQCQKIKIEKINGNFAELFNKKGGSLKQAKGSK